MAMAETLTAPKAPVKVEPQKEEPKAPEQETAVEAAADDTAPAEELAVYRTDEAPDGDIRVSVAGVDRVIVADGDKFPRVIANRIAESPYWEVRE